MNSVQKITASDVEQMTCDELIRHLDSFKVRKYVSEQFFSEEEREELHRQDKEYERLAENNGIAIREMNHLDYKSIKSFIVMCMIDEYNLKFYPEVKNFEEIFQVFAKCSRKKCKKLATHKVYRIVVGKGGWTTVKRKQYCEIHLNQI